MNDLIGRLIVRLQGLGKFSKKKFIFDNNLIGQHIGQHINLKVTIIYKNSKTNIKMSDFRNLFVKNITDQTSLFNAPTPSIPKS